ncbi:hypothetical protein OSB04_010127, partial [Centaurea solstitialis]
MKTSIHTINLVFAIFSLLLHNKSVISFSHQLNNANGISKCFHKERHALLHFKDGLEDIDDQLFSWRLEDDDCCKWSGVTCNNQTHHVTKLDLFDLFLGGELRSSLVNLTYLNHLDLSSNFFKGTIPSFIGSMSCLMYLDLHDNYFDGTIPKSIGSLTRLRYLDLSDNFLHGSIPSEFGNLTNLQNLLLGTSEGSMVENLDWLSNLSHLQHLQMDMISLAKANHWVDVILSLKTLSYLSLWGCDLSEVTHPYSSLVNSSSSSIVFLSLGNNNLNSSMYRWLFPLSGKKLLNLDLSNNKLDGIPVYLGNLCSLTSLSLYGNSIVVNFSNVLKNLSGCTMVTLQELDVSDNQLTGSLSDGIIKFSSLESLTLSNNHLNGTLSEKVWELPNLETLDVSTNSLVGGTIPVEFWKTWPSQLTYLNLSSNNISGEVPDLSSNFDSYSTIDISSNSFYGTISNVPPTLLSLNLSKNKFHGGISFLCQIVGGSLSFLNLSHNSLTGKLPDCLWHFNQLKVLNLGHNRLSGRIPASIGLRSNNFFGPIPLQLCHLMNLQILDLSTNNLDGSIPSCVNNLTSMVHRRSLPKNNMHGYGKLHNEEGDITMVGRIPSSTQLQSFEPSKYTGNAGLCGPPVTKSCPTDEVPPVARLGLRKGGGVHSKIAKGSTYVVDWVYRKAVV